jgi:hypothetical protein
MPNHWRNYPINADSCAAWLEGAIEGKADVAFGPPSLRLFLCHTIERQSIQISPHLCGYSRAIAKANRRLDYLFKGKPMFTLTFQTASRAITLRFAAVVVATTLSTAAWATTGRDAVGMCIDSTASGARCGWAVSKDGSIDICNKNGCVTCPSATAECTPAKKRPKQPLKYSATPAERLLASPR